jgi:ferric-dicitrate binding protein FerR (iron transport regulator)
MNLSNQDDHLNFLAKYLAGEATPEEAMELEKWLKNKDNKIEFDRVSQLWDKVSKTFTPIPDKQLAWRKLQEATGIKARPGIRKIRYYRYAAAACITALIIISAFILIYLKPTPVQQNDLVTKSHRDEVVTDTMPDGSKITLNRNSSISYHSSYNTKAREVTLTGESYFDIMPDMSSPFIISIDDLKILVVGTSFNVRPDIDSIEVQVTSGIVKMIYGGKEITITKGQTGVYLKNDHSLRLVNSINLNSISYATKSFYFKDIPLIDAFKYMEDAFDMKIKFDDKKFSACRLTAEFENKTIGYILNVISATFDINYQISGKNINVTGEGCK